MIVRITDAKELNRGPRAGKCLTRVCMQATELQNPGS